MIELDGLDGMKQVMDLLWGNTPKDRAVMRILKANSGVKVRFNNELQMWKIYLNLKKGELFLIPKNCTYEKGWVILHNNDGTSTRVGYTTMEKEFVVMYQIRDLLLENAPIDRIAMRLLKANLGGIKARFRNGIWEFYLKEENLFIPEICMYEKGWMFLHNDDGTSTLVGYFHFS